MTSSLAAVQLGAAMAKLRDKTPRTREAIAPERSRSQHKEPKERSIGADAGSRRAKPAGSKTSSNTQVVGGPKGRRSSPPAEDVSAAPMTHRGSEGRKARRRSESQDRRRSAKEARQARDLSRDQRRDGKVRRRSASSRSLSRKGHRDERQERKAAAA